MRKLIRKLSASIRGKPKPYRVMWNSHVPAGICLNCRFFRTLEQREKFCRTLVKDPNFICFM